MTALRLIGLLVAAVLCGSRPAAGQIYLGGRDTPRRGTVEVGGGGTWAPGFETGTSVADLTRSGQQSERFDLFSTEGEVSGFPGAHARLGVYLSRSVAIEAGFRFARPELAYRLSGDAESAADETAAEVISHYVFDGSLLFHFTPFAEGRAVTFVSGGAGYVRELHEGNELVETGNELHVTAGLKYWFGSGRRRMGLRAEIGVSSREKGFDKGEGRRTLPLALGGVAFLF